MGDNMNPNLMRILEDARNYQEGGNFLDREIEEYAEMLRVLDNAYLKDPAKWPWKDQTNGYIKTLRMLVGHFPLALPVATAVVLDNFTNILLERRSDDEKWSIPGGIVLPNQSVKDCVVADIARETGLIAEPENLHLFDEISTGKPHNYPNGDILYSVKVVYVAKHCRGSLKINYENLDLEYFNLEELPKNISGSTREIAKRLVERFDEVTRW